MIETWITELYDEGFSIQQIARDTNLTVKGVKLILYQIWKKELFSFWDIKTNLGAEL